MTQLYFWDAEQSTDYPPTEEQLNNFPARYAERYRTAKAEMAKQQATGSATLLAMYLGVTSDDDLVEGEHGRLMLSENASQRYFSLSHSDSVTVLAVSDQPVAVDLEHIREFPESIPLRFYPPSFQETLDSAREEERDETFYRLWTQLEAAVKLDGRGLTAPRGEFQEIINRYNITTEREGDLIWSIATEK